MNTIRVVLAVFSSYSTFCDMIRSKEVNPNGRKSIDIGQIRYVYMRDINSSRGIKFTHYIWLWDYNKVRDLGKIMYNIKSRNPDIIELDQI